MKKVIRWITLAVFLLIANVEALAQTIPAQKEFNYYTSGGVDLMTGYFRLYSEDISVGSGAFPSRLNLIREMGQYPSQADRAYVTNNFILSANCSPCGSGVQSRLTIKALDGVHVYTSPYVAWGSARTWTNLAQDGSLVIDNGGVLEFRSKSGVQIYFAATSATATGPGCGSYCRVPVYAVVPYGGSIVFSYENIPATALPGLPASSWPFSRLKSVANSRGYGLQFSYVNQSTTSGDTTQMYLQASVSAYRTGCVQGVVNCASGLLGSVSYGWTLVEVNSIGEHLYRMTSFTDTQGRTLNYEHAGQNMRLTSASYADKPDVKLFQNTYANWQTSTSTTGYLEGVVVKQVDALGQVTLYSTGYRPSTPRTRPTTTITAPNGGVTTYNFTATFDGAVIGLPTSVVDPLSRTSTYTYDNGRLLSATNPQGGKVAYVLDDRGNVTQKTVSPNTGATESVLVEQAGFPMCDSQNFRYCNNPSFTVDSRGGRTDYQYSTSNGQPTVILSPANADGVRAVTRKGYAAFYPAPGVTAPSGIALVPDEMQTTSDTCLSSPVTGATVDFSFVCTAGARERTSWIYTQSVASARTNHELEGIVDDADGSAFRTCFRYDVAGNQIAETRPRAGLASCPA